MTTSRNWLKRLYNIRLHRAVTPAVSADSNEVYLTLLDEYDYRKLEIQMSPREARTLASRLNDYANRCEDAYADAEAEAERRAS